MRNLQQEIIKTLGVSPEINPAEEIENRIEFLVTKLGESGLQGYTLGISGGQDSLLAGLLTQQAVERLRANGQDAEFHALLLPYGQQADRQDALDACATIQPDHITDIDIQAGVDAITDSLAAGLGHDIRDFDKGNIKARMRMIAHYAIAGDSKLLVVGTDHAAEAVTGFFTKYGDGGADILPLSGLTKRQGKQLLRELGAPERFITKAPTADLLDAKPGQTDESELGLTYDQLDDYLEGKTVSETIAAAIEHRYLATIHKREAPITYTNTSATL